MLPFLSRNGRSHQAGETTKREEKVPFCAPWNRRFRWSESFVSQHLSRCHDESLSVSLVKKLTKINFFLGSNGVRDFENWKKKEKKKKEEKKKEKEEGKNRDTRRVREIGEEWNDSIRSSTIDNIAVHQYPLG